MIYKRRSPLPGCVRIIFELPSCIWADQIEVVGDFNGWHLEATPMQQDHEGIWHAVVDLPQNSRHEFRYLVNREWMTDYHADGYVANHFGSDNSVVIATLAESLLLVKPQSTYLVIERARRFHQPLHQPG
ncbi:MAG TPA: isoamylase early set domain-containing protein [Caldilineaceae bacterium]|nr:isoamylase early set domain-containing protein [Caldilineaceae bacterium]